MSSRSHTYRPNRAQKGKNHNKRGRNSIHRDSVSVKKEHVGHLIGRGGAAIRGLQQKYGIRSKIDEGKLLYLLSGPKRNVDAAVAEIRQTISKLSDAYQETSSRKMVTDDDGWTYTGVKTSVQPVRKIHRPPAIVIPKNRFEFGDSSDEDEDEPEQTIPTADYKEQKPEGQWANGVVAAVKEEGQTRLSVGMLKQRLAVAKDELAKAEKALAYHQSQNTGSWADETDIADAQDDVYTAEELVESITQELVERFTAEIANY